MTKRYCAESKQTHTIFTTTTTDTTTTNIINTEPVHQKNKSIEENNQRYHDRLVQYVKDDMKKLDPNVRVEMIPLSDIEALVKLLIKSGGPIDDEDPAYVLFQIDFDELNGRRTINRAALNACYTQHGGPPLDAAAVQSRSSFVNWLDQVILNIPNVSQVAPRSFFFIK